MKVVLLTSNNLRHKYIASAISKELELSLIISEKKSPKIQESLNYNKEDADLMANHFRARLRSEELFFDSYESFATDIPHLHIPHANINSNFVFASITEADPEFIILFGTSIIQNPLLQKFKGRIINLHLGLSPYYKGSATNLYPYLFHEPECVGATVHLATEKVDEGGILHQFRPEIEENDDLHTIGNKTILAAGNILPPVIKAYYAGRIQPVQQTSGGMICRNKDITPDVVREIYKNFDTGMIPEYLDEKNGRDAAKPIISQL